MNNESTVPAAGTSTSAADDRDTFSRRAKTNKCDIRKGARQIKKKKKGGWGVGPSESTSGVLVARSHWTTPLHLGSHDG